ncbi:MAG: CBS domain-containing protein [Hahellaceae bacterium]|nr:CBS domain-containing protein [Hahellaceae bacterium]MCP5211913.1 CBS domain-containing protein [Hahellaceae bacterium]
MFFFVHDINNRIKAPVKPSKTIKPVAKTPAPFSIEATATHSPSTAETYPSSPRIATGKNEPDQTKAYKNDSITAFDIMSSPIISADMSLPIDQVESLMDRYETNHIVITSEEGYIEGILTKENLLKKRLDSNMNGSTKQKYYSEIYSTQPLIPADEVAKLMLSLKLDAVLVMENDYAIGIITLTNFLEMIALKEKNLDLRG